LKRQASTDWDKLDGYWRRKSGQVRYIIKREVFNALFSTTAQMTLVLQHLIQNGQITMAVAKGGGASAARIPKRSFGRMINVVGPLKLSSPAADRLGKTMRTRLPSIEAIGQNAPLRLGVAAALPFPDGTMPASGVAEGGSTRPTDGQPSGGQPPG
jgi:hypothetical protein